VSPRPVWRPVAALAAATLLRTGCFGVGPLSPGGWLEPLYPGRIVRVVLTVAYGAGQTPAHVQAQLAQPGAIARLAADIDRLATQPRGAAVSCAFAASLTTAAFVFADARTVTVAYLPACGDVDVAGRSYADPRGRAWAARAAAAAVAKPPLCLTGGVLRPCGPPP
jgi:hypothetical protein